MLWQKFTVALCGPPYDSTASCSASAYVKNLLLARCPAMYEHSPEVARDAAPTLDTLHRMSFGTSMSDFQSQQLLDLFNPLMPMVPTKGHLL